MRNSKMLHTFRAGNFVRVCAMGHYLPHFGFDDIWLDLDQLQGA